MVNHSRGRHSHKSGAVTLADVAQAAGVSLATASRALHGSGDRNVRPQLQQAVEEAAAKLRYVSNINAQATARGHAAVLGLVVHDIGDPYFSAIAVGAMRAAERHGVAVTVTSTNRDPQRELEFARLLRQQRARAMVLAGSRIDDHSALDEMTEELRQFRRMGGRTTVIGQDRLGVGTVVVDNRAGARDLAAALHDVGHRRFAVLAAPGRLLTARDRLTGFREALRARGCSVPDSHVFRTEFTWEGGHDAARWVLDRGLDVTCIFAVNDVMALGALAALRAHGGPGALGIGVAGFDDIATLRDVVPGVSTVRLPLEEMGEMAVAMALDDDDHDPRVVHVSGEVILRESTALS